MDIKEITKVIALGAPYEVTRREILRILSKDTEVIQDILLIIDAERRQKKELITELNVLLSKADCIIDDPGLNKDRFASKEILEFYRNHKGKIGHCFKDIDKMG